MNRTEILRPCHPLSSNVTGAVRVLIVELYPDLKFAPKEWKILQTGVSAALREPALLCICDMQGDRVHKDVLHGAFHLANSQHGSPNIPIRVHNLTRTPQKNKDDGPCCLEFAIFALKLEQVPTLDSMLTRVTVRKHEDKKVSPTKVSKPSPRRRRLLRLSCDNMRWFTSEKDTKCAILTVDLKDIFDHKKVTGINVLTISDPHTVIQETQLQKGTSTLFIFVAYYLKQGYAAPETLNMMISLETSKPAVCFKHGTESFLTKSDLNGFILKPHRPLHARQNNTLTITSGAIYTSEKYHAIFLPYNVPGVDIHVVPWRPNDRLSVTITALEDVSIPAKTPLGEIRFFSHSAMRLGPERKQFPSIGQLAIEAHGPEIYASTDLIKDLELDAQNADILRQRNDDNDIEQDSEIDEDEEEELDIDALDLVSVTSDERNRLLELSDNDDDENGDEGTSADPTEPNHRMSWLDTYRHYANNASGPVPDEENVPAARLGMQQRRETMAANLETEYEDFEVVFKLKLQPLEVRFTEEALSDFTFWIPIYRFSKNVHAFHYTFLRRGREVLKFRGLKAVQSTNSKNVSQENQPQPLRT